MRVLMCQIWFGTVVVVLALQYCFGITSQAGRLFLLPLLACNNTCIQTFLGQQLEEQRWVCLLQPEKRWIMDVMLTWKIAKPLPRHAKPALNTITES
jgi:hypothetical protein